jgi:CheY-like chemotaxis protein
MSSARRHRVLVVEDEPIIRNFLEDGLTDAGFNVTTAHNGAVALDRVTDDPPDAVLLDLLMPVMDGLAFLRQRQQQPRLASLPVVVLSAGGLSALRDAAALRATATLPKPVDLDVLSSVLDHVLRDFQPIPVDPSSADAADRQAVGTCPICGRTAYALLDPRLTSAERLAAIHAVRQSHVMSHRPTDLARAPLRTRLLNLPLDRRRILADWMYRELRQEWGDCDRRGMYSVDEVLHSPDLHRLWHDAASCGQRHCRHA